MSAVESLEPLGLPERGAASPARTRPALRLLAPSRARLSRFPFVLMLLGILALGMGLLVVVNTQIQSQAAELAALEREATELHQQRAQLQAEVNQRRSVTSLQQQAQQMGMRPNPHPAFIVLPSGKILGQPTEVTGKEVPDQTYVDWKASQEAQENSRAAVAREKAEADRRARELAQQRAEEEKARRLAAQKPSASPSARPSTSVKPSPSTKPSTRPTLIKPGDR